MRISVIIPLWNGAEVIERCLHSLFDTSGEELLEVICVDNASVDESRALVEREFPQAIVLPQPVNLGFAGGVNVGLHAARGDILVLLNQDLLVHRGWTSAVCALFERDQHCGIAGAVIMNADGSVNHAGADIEHPLANGTHLTAVDARPAWRSTYVTGAFFAISRKAWGRTGDFDDAFYPAYYEESDYCFRARRHGFEVCVVDGMRGTHLFSSREWQRDPIRHTAFQHRSRYRFICKHFTDVELPAFLDAELDATAAEISFHQAVGRVLAATYALRVFDAWLADRVADGNLALSRVVQRQLHVGLNAIRQASLDRALLLSLPGSTDDERRANAAEEWHTLASDTQKALDTLRQFRTQQESIMDHLAGKDEPTSNEPPSGLQRYRQDINTKWEIVSGQQRKETLNLIQLGLWRANQLEEFYGHRLNLLERRTTILECRQKLSELLAKYELF